jgi:hypothetical protein
MGSTYITDYPAELYLTTDASATVKVDGGYVRILRKNISIITVDYQVEDATTTTKGIVRLAGDLSGTANNPTVPELANKVPTSRTVSTTSPLLGGGALSSNLSLSIQQSNSVDSGYLSNVDWITFNGKANDNAVVKLTGDQTISGVKTFSSPTIFNSSLNITSGAYNILYNPANSSYWQTYVDSSNVFYFGFNGNVVKASINNSGNFTANSFIKSGGTSSQFLKADGSVDSTSYQTALTNPVTGTGTSGQIAYWNGTSSITGESNLFWDATNDRLGIGTTSPNSILTIGSTDATAVLTAGGGNTHLTLKAMGSQGELIFGAGGVSNGVAGTERMRITSGGNVGIGVVPSSSWATGFKALQMTGGTSLLSHPTVPVTYLGANYLATDSGAKYIQSDGAARFLVNGYSSNFSWDIAPAGTAGNAITFTTAMTLASTGNLLIGTTTDAGYKLQVNGSVRSTSGYSFEYGGGIYAVNYTYNNVLLTGYDPSAGDFVDFYTPGDGVSNATKKIRILNNGTTTFYGNVYAPGFFNSSDIRLKELTPYNYNVSDIKPITYLWKDGRDNKKHVGYSAQEVQKVMPDAVNEDEKGFLSVNYVEVLVAKISQMEKEIAYLKSKI